MISIRPARADDLVGVQDCNISCLPENYTFKYFYYHYILWPDLMFVAEDVTKKKVVGYVMGKIDDQEESEIGEKKGHITSISVLRNYRRMGIAVSLMNATHMAMKSIFEVNHVTLHVRESNSAALALYSKALSYSIEKVDKEYFADKEDAYFMKKQLTEIYPEC